MGAQINLLEKSVYKKTAFFSIILFILGFLVFSPCSTLITIDILHLPLSLPELLFIPFIPFFIKNIRIANPFKQREFWILFTIWLFLVVFGCFWNKPFAVFSTARTYLYILITYAIFIKRNNISLNDVYLIAIGSTIGWLATAFYNFKTLILEGDEGITYGPLLAIGYVLGYSAFKENRLQMLSFTIISIIIGFMAGLRRELAIAAIAIFSSIMLITSLRPLRFVKYAIVLGSLAVIMVFSYSSIAEVIKSNSQFIYNRVILKTESMFDGTSNSGDDTRSENIANYFLELDQYVFPLGFVNKQFSSDDNSNGLYNDIPITELSTTMGFLLTFALIGYFGYASMKIYGKIYKKHLSQQYLVLIISFIIMFSLLFMEGSFLTFPYCAPYTGGLLGMIQRESGMKIRI